MKKLIESGLKQFDATIYEIRARVINLIFFPSSNSQDQNSHQNDQDNFKPIRLKVTLKGVFSVYVLGIFISLLILITEIIYLFYRKKRASGFIIIREFLNLQFTRLFFHFLIKSLLITAHCFKISTKS